jgi:hypothetical protein
LAEFLETVKGVLGGKPIMVNSAFRSKAVNDAVGSKDTSQHRVGCAADLRVPGMTPDEVVKAIIASGIGYDQIPEDIRNSPVLTGNDLGHLGGIEELPNETEVNEYKLLELSELFLTLEDKPFELELALHKKAKFLLAENKLEEAWMTLLSFNNG